MILCAVRKDISRLKVFFRFFVFYLFRGWKLSWRKTLYFFKESYEEWFLRTIFKIMLRNFSWKISGKFVENFLIFKGSSMNEFHIFLFSQHWKIYLKIKKKNVFPSLHSMSPSSWTINFNFTVQTPFCLFEIFILLRKAGGIYAKTVYLLCDIAAEGAKSV